MGLLTGGTALDWKETKKYADYVRKHGVQQFINMYHKLMNRPRDSLKYGDEMEYSLVKFDHENKTVKTLLIAEEILPTLQEEEDKQPEDCNILWRPEYMSYHLEASPGKPYESLPHSLTEIETNMNLRRHVVSDLLAEDEVMLSIVNFPRLGCPNFSMPSYNPSPSDDSVFNSVFLPDETIFKAHPRFITFTRNIWKRRGDGITINVPIYKDIYTPSPFIDDILYGSNDRTNRAKPDHIFMDSTGFSFGCTCLQVTLQGCDLDETRHLYDQLAVICPIMLALSAASPIKRGYLSDVDSRWFVSAEGTDDRTPEERGLEPLTTNPRRIAKSRFDSLDSYLSEKGQRYSDIDLEFDEELYLEMVNSGIVEPVARHVAHLFIRDPILLLREKIYQDDENEMEHFESIQSTNWQTLRFKPPPPNSDIGWRVEFRPMEVQLTDFENAAFVVFIVLLTRTILTFDLNLLMPISKVDINMKTAHMRDAINRFPFYFTKNVWSCPTSGDINEETAAMSIDVIINGGILIDGKKHPGLIPLIWRYLDMIDVDVDTMIVIQKYLQLISDRASGKRPTIAHWMREFVRSHPNYKFDSEVSEEISYDLMRACVDITNGTEACKHLGKFLSNDSQHIKHTEL